LDYVFNEWFVEYMSPESSQVQLVWRLLDELEAKNDRLVIRRKSPFIRKFYALNKLYGAVGQASRPVFKRFALLRFSPERIRIVDEHEIQSVLGAVLDGVDNDDHYLVELAAVTEDKTIITTDTQLRDVLNDKEGFRVTLLGDFVSEYLASA